MQGVMELAHASMAGGDLAVRTMVVVIYMSTAGGNHDLRSVVVGAYASLAGCGQPAGSVVVSPSCYPATMLRIEKYQCRVRGDHGWDAAALDQCR